MTVFKAIIGALLGSLGMGFMIGLMCVPFCTIAFLILWNYIKSRKTIKEHKHFLIESQESLRQKVSELIFEYTAIKLNRIKVTDFSHMASDKYPSMNLYLYTVEIQDEFENCLSSRLMANDNNYLYIRNGVKPNEYLIAVGDIYLLYEFNL